MPDNEYPAKETIRRIISKIETVIAEELQGVSPEGRDEVIAASAVASMLLAAYYVAIGKKAKTALELADLMKYAPWMEIAKSSLIQLQHRVEEYQKIPKA